MKLPLVSLKPLNSVFCFFLLSLGAFFSLSAAAVDEDKLWMPLKYQSYYISLKEAAIAAHALTRCTEVIEGTIDISQSKPDHPIFRILCRQANMRSYVEMVDGLTMQTLTTQEYSPIETMKRKAEKFARECKQALLKETTLMQEFNLLFDEKSAPQNITENEVVFLLDFDAQGGQGETLKYRANCRVDSEEVVHLKIRPRRSSDS